MACLSFWIEIKKLPLSKKAYPTNAWSAWAKVNILSYFPEALQRVSPHASNSRHMSG
jgi:hypothetical protein